MRFAVYGSGGVGAYFGARLAVAGYDVSFVARGEHLRAMRANGLRVDSVLGDFHLESVRATDDPAQIGAVDFVLLGVKCWQVRDAAVSLQPLLGHGAAVVTLQNGVDAPESLGELIGRQQVLPGLVKLFTRIRAPGCIEHLGGPGLIAFGEWDGSPSERVGLLKEAFVRSNVLVETPRDIRAALWNKLLFVAAMGGVGAVSRAPVGILRSMPETRSLLEQCMKEIEAVARAEGVQLLEDVVTKTLGFIDAQPVAGESSLQRDIAAGRPSELEEWLGGVVRRAAARGVAAPLCSFLYASLLPQERCARGGGVPCQPLTADSAAPPSCPSPAIAGGRDA